MTFPRALRLALLASGAVLLAGSQGLAARAPAASTSTSYDRSGLVTVNGDGEQVRLHATNASEAAWTAQLDLIAPSGKILATRTIKVLPGDTATLTLAPGKTTGMRGVITVAWGVSEPCVLPLLEVVTTRGGAHAAIALDSFHEEVVTTP